jgi:hypothetical protein
MSAGVTFVSLRSRLCGSKQDISILRTEEAQIVKENFSNAHAYTANKLQRVT